MDRTKSPGLRGHYLVGLLLMTLLLAGLLAYQAHDAARSHRDAAEAVLQDYAAFATWEYARRVQATIRNATHQTLHPLFEPGGHTIARQELPSVDALAAGREAGAEACGMLDSVEAYYRLDTGSRTLTTTGAKLSREVETWLVDRLSGLTESGRPPTREGAIFGDLSGGAWAAGYALAPYAGAEPDVVLGFVARADRYASVCGDLFPGGPLLPPSLTGGVRNDSLLSVMVTTAGGVPLCASPLQFESKFAARDSLGPAIGGLVVEAALRPEAASSLLIGGLPSSRMLLVLGLLLLTVGLILAALIQLRRERELTRLRERFVSNVSHELRTPLAQIRMFAETLMLGRVRSDRERHQSLKVIDREARRLSQLVDNVLRFSRGQRGMVRITPESTAVGPLVQEVVHEFAPLASTRGMEIRTDLEPRIILLLDRGAFRQMLLNLLDNAVKFGPRGQTITVRVHRSDDSVRVVVDDQGPGIPPSERGRIWAPFNRLERNEGMAVAGTGIGLAIVRELAEMHGGRVNVDDSPDGGGRFVVVLPGAWGLEDPSMAEPSKHAGVA